MPVNYTTPAASDIHPVSGVRLGVAEAGIRKPNRRDLTLVALDPGCTVGGVFTTNRFCAAPVQVCQSHLATGEIRALVINTGVANAGTGEPGLVAARATCEAVGALLEIAPESVLPFSTGVILEPLPVDRLVAGLPAASLRLDVDGWFEAAHGIMTTDTVAKLASRQIRLSGKLVTITGISKGAGMIKPNMATMLGFVATDAGVSQALLERLVRQVADQSFNCITVDGDTSTNDSFIVIASGQSGAFFAVESDPDFDEFRTALTAVARELAQAIVRDGEGATKFMSIAVSGGANTDECRRVGYAVAQSPLVKTAFFASDPNLGRILAAIGYAGIGDLDVNALRVWLAAGQDEVLVAEKGGRAMAYQEAVGARIMRNAEITIRIDLARGTASSTVWTCDFSYDYVKINADYRS